MPDELLHRLRLVSLEEAWGTCRKHGYHNQFEGNWVITEDNPVLVGRAVTAFFLPLRPDVNEVVQEWGKKTGQKGGQNSWIIDTLVKGDVMVVDLMGKVVDATLVGDNLANSVWARTGTGIIVDGGARDLEGVSQIPSFPVFNRGWDPSYLQGMTLMGINTPIRVGRAVVMPGDAVLAKTRRRGLRPRAPRARGGRDIRGDPPARPVRAPAAARGKVHAWRDRHEVDGRDRKGLPVVGRVEEGRTNRVPAQKFLGGKK